ncbi:MAG: spore maturation protein [Clostridia bacterium]|nr:spore maturation protein [Clostridia bacterium]
MTWVLPLLLLVIGISFLTSGKSCLQAFLRGARAGLASCADLFPTLLLFVCAVSLFRASGAIAWMSTGLSGVCRFLHIPTELLPLLLTRPVSGSASSALLADVLQTHGPDSPIGMTASVLCGASETVLYVLSVYTVGMPLSSTRHLIPAAALTCLFVTALSLLLCCICFGV